MKIMAIDPGLAKTGCALYNPSGKGHILAVKTLTTPADGPDPTTAQVIERGTLMGGWIVGLIEQWQPDVVVMEEYVDIPGKLRGARRRWTTPMVIGVIATMVDEPIEWQSSETVMTASRIIKQMWQRGQYGLIEGDKLLTNDHLRDAAIHADFWAAQNIKRGRHVGRR